jgi:hypothetical protein
MVARVAPGTLAGSRSGSWAGIHKEAARGDFSRLGRHRRVLRRAHLCRPSRSWTSSSGTISATARTSSSRSASPAVRDSSVREARRREPAVVCQQPSVGRSPQLGDRRRSRPPGRRDYRNRAKGIARPELAARAEAVVARSVPARLDVGDCDSAPGCWAVDSEQAQSRVAWAPAGPRDRRDLDHPVVAWRGVAVISSPARHTRCSPSGRRDTAESDELRVAMPYKARRLCGRRLASSSRRRRRVATFWNENSVHARRRAFFCRMSPVSTPCPRLPTGPRR